MFSVILCQLRDFHYVMIIKNNDEILVFLCVSKKPKDYLDEIEFNYVINYRLQGAEFCSFSICTLNIITHEYICMQSNGFRFPIHSASLDVEHRNAFLHERISLLRN